MGVGNEWEGKMWRYLLGEAVMLFLVSIYAYLLGSSTSTMHYTGRTLTSHHVHDGEELIFKSELIRFVTRYHSWYIPNEVHYSFSVDLHVDAIKRKTYSVPLRCSPWLVRYTYPHRQAINLCLAHYIENGLP